MSDHYSDPISILVSKLSLSSGLSSALKGKKKRPVLSFTESRQQILSKDTTSAELSGF